MSLLPPNVTHAERALESAMLSDIDLASVGTLWDPATCPAAVLPFLAWGLAITHWDSTWTEAEKRAAVAAAIPYHRTKGTRAAVEQVLARFSPLLELVPWWQASPPRDPYTFEVRAPAVEMEGILTDEVAAAIVRDVAAAKGLRDHFDFVQVLEAQGTAWLASSAQSGTLLRAQCDAVHDASRDWSIVLQTEDGEPILTEDGLDYLETE